MFLDLNAVDYPAVSMPRLPITAHPPQPAHRPLRIHDSFDNSTTTTTTFTFPPSATPTAPKTMAALPTSLFRWVVPGAIAVSLLQSSLYDVKGGTRAVIFDRLSGVKEDVVNEGTHFLVPWLQRAIVYDVRTRPRNISTTTGSKDLQMVTLTLRVLHRPEVRQLPKIYQVCFLHEGGGCGMGVGKEDWGWGGSWGNGGGEAKEWVDME